MTTTTLISHNGSSYELNTGCWLKHRFSDPSEAIKEVYTDDIRLNDGMTVGGYKKNRREEFLALEDTMGLTNKKYLDKSFKSDFGVQWDDGIAKLKEMINESCIRLITEVNKRALSKEEQYEILKAASNGHVAAMYWIGTALSDKKDDNCLLWLSMAHNRGHIGACYEMAKYLFEENNVIGCISCLIIAADSGADVAYMGLFDINLLRAISREERLDELSEMLVRLSKESHFSGARYFQAVLAFMRKEKSKGVRLLEVLAENPRNRPSEKDSDETYQKQVAFTKGYIGSVLRDIQNGNQPLNALISHAKKKHTYGFIDYDELLDVIYEN